MTWASGGFGIGVGRSVQVIGIVIAVVSEPHRHGPSHRWFVLLGQLAGEEAGTLEDLGEDAGENEQRNRNNNAQTFHPFSLAVWRFY